MPLLQALLELVFLCMCHTHLLQAALSCSIRCKPRCGIAVSACAVHVEHMATRRLVLHTADGLKTATQAQVQSKVLVNYL